MERGGVKRCEKAKNKELPPDNRASEKEEASGACRRPEPSAAKSDCTKPARACATHSEWSVRLEHLYAAGWLPRRWKEEMCFSLKIRRTFVNKSAALCTKEVRTLKEL